MPDYTPKLTLPKPTASEIVTRAAHNSLVDAMDSGAASQTQADRPFHLDSVSYDSANNRIVCTLNAGRVTFNGTVVDIETTSTVYITAPSANTYYTIYVKSDGTFPYNTTGAILTGAVPIWQVHTGSVVSTLTSSDLRGEVSGSDSRAIGDLLTTHQTAGVLDHPNNSVTNSKIAPGAVTTDKMANGAATGSALGTDVVTTSTGASGDLSGTYPSPTVAKLQGRAIANTAPGSGQNLQWNGSQWVPASPPNPPTSLPPNGAAGGALSGSYPNPGLAPGVATGGVLGADVIKVGTAAGGGLTGTYPNPAVAPGAIDPTKMGAGYHARITGPTQGIPSGSYPPGTVVSFNAVRFDTNAFFNGGLPTRLTINKNGFYLVGFNIGFGANANGERLAWIRMNGSTNIGGSLRFGANPINFTVLNGMITWWFNAGDYIELMVAQTSGSTINVNSTGDDSPEFFASFLTA